MPIKRPSYPKQPPRVKVEYAKPYTPPKMEYALRGRPTRPTSKVEFAVAGKPVRPGSRWEFARPAPKRKK